MSQGEGGGRPVKFDSAEVMQHIIDLYFITMKANRSGDVKFMEGMSDDDLLIVNDIEGIIPSMSGLAYALDMSRETLVCYGRTEKFSDTVIRARHRIEISLECRLSGTSPAGTIFNLKNNFGWKDKTETELTFSPEDLKGRSTADLEYHQLHGRFPHNPNADIPVHSG